MKKDDRIQVRLRRVMMWPLYLLPVLAVLTFAVYLIDHYAGAAVGIFDLVYVIFMLRWLASWRKQTEDELVDFAVDFQQQQKNQISSLPIPYAILGMGGELLWGNRKFEEIVPEEDGEFQIRKMLPSLGKSMPEDDTKFVEHIRWKRRAYQAELQMVSGSAGMYSLFLFDETAHLAALDEIERQRAVVGQICIDNYDEAMSGAEQVRQSLLAALIERKITKYFSSHDGIVVATERDKFTVFMRKKGLYEVMADRFSILEDVKTLNIGNNIAVTLSISMGTGGRTMEQNNEFARNALNLALGRGGDQAIVKTADSIQYFGGKTQRQEKNTRVKARVKAQALRELMLTRGKVLIMGHHIPDMDSFGAAVGIYLAARSLEKEVHIVMTDISSSLRPLVNRFQANRDYPTDMIISGDKAKLLRDINTMVVVVDVNRPSYTECPALLDRTGTVVVLDHHRQGGETIQKATLSYIEPYASSASEMVAEVLQYFGDNVKIRPIEAETIYAGIVMDTDNFVTNTGVRTFEAAAFLRRQGADVTRVRKLFRERMEDSQAKAATISNAEIFADCFAIGVCDGAGIESPTIVGAEAANAMLDIIGVKASFVFTEFHDTIYISARSIDEVNVQLIMERVGGGGHLNVAGAQMEGVSVEEAKERVEKVIQQMLAEGAL